MKNGWMIQMKIQEDHNKNSKKLNLKVNNMVCESCEKIIEKHFVKFEFLATFIKAKK